MTRRNFLIAERIIFGLLTLIAIGTQLTVHISHKFDVINFFSYFTNLSNIFAAIVFLVGAVFLIQRREPTPAQETIRGASVVAMVIVGIVYSLLLRNEDLGTLLPWVNFVIHFLMPVVVLFDWLFQPPKTQMGARQLASWLIYPLLFLVYTLVRGPIAKFYPYPFLNPANGGYGVVAIYGAGIFITFLIVGSVLSTAANRLPHNVA
jgi:hypothetical protein